MKKKTTHKLVSRTYRLSSDIVSLINKYAGQKTRGNRSAWVELVLKKAINERSVK